MLSVYFQGTIKNQVPFQTRPHFQAFSRLYRPWCGNSFFFLMKIVVFWNNSIHLKYISRPINTISWKSGFGAPVQWEIKANLSNCIYTKKIPTLGSVLVRVLVYETVTWWLKSMSTGNVVLEYCEYEYRVRVSQPWLCISSSGETRKFNFFKSNLTLKVKVNCHPKQ